MNTELTLKTYPVHSVLIKSLDGDYLKQGNHWLTFVQILRGMPQSQKKHEETDKKGLDTGSNYQEFCDIRRYVVYAQAEQSTEKDVAVSQ